MKGAIKFTLTGWIWCVLTVTCANLTKSTGYFLLFLPSLGYTMRSTSPSPIWELITDTHSCLPAY